MNRLWTVGLCAAALALLIGSQAWAQPRQGRGGGLGMRGGVNLQELVTKLDLTEAQKPKVKDVLTKAREEARADFEKNREKFAELRTQMQAAREANDQAKLVALQAERAKLFNPEAQQKATLEKLKAVLTEEQNKKLTALVLEARRAAVPPQVVVETLAKNAERLGVKEEAVTKAKDLLKAQQDETAKVMAGDDDRRTKFQKARELVAKFNTDLKSVLTAEQQEKFDKALAQGRGGRRGGGTAGPDDAPAPAPNPAPNPAPTD